MYKAFVSLLCLIIAVAAMPIIVYATSVNGISASSRNLNPGDSFTVSLNIPATENADTASIRVEFDSTAFEVTSWSPNISNGLFNSGEGFFAVSAANAIKEINLVGGLELKAGIKVKESAKTGDYSIRLTKYSISYVKDNGYEFVELWNPSVKEVTVRVGTTSGNGRTETTSITTSANSSDGGDDPVIITDDDSGETTSQSAPTTSEEEAIVIGDDDDDSTFTTNDETTVPVTSKANITLTAILEGLPKGKINTSTKSNFFSEDTEIRLTNSTDSKTSAEYAIDNLNLKNHAYYSFDISLYGNESGKKIHSLGNGYIDFTVPIPTVFGQAPYELNVYHIENGYTQLVPSEIIFEDGLGKIKFRANSFSPYMIVDMVGELVKPAQTGSGTTGDGSENSDGRPLNPNTGVGAAIIIPSALIGCMLLSRKHIKNRKRTRKYI